MTTPAPWQPRPARGYSWADFADGNLAAVKFGHRSPRVIAEVVAELLPELAAHHPWLGEERFRLSTEALLRAEAVARLQYRRLSALVDAEPDDQRWSSAVRDWRSAENLAAARRAECSITPGTVADLERSAMAAARERTNLDALAARGRAALDSRYRALEAAASDGTDQDQAEASTASPAAVGAPEPSDQEDTP